MDITFSINVIWDGKWALIYGTEHGSLKIGCTPELRHALILGHPVFRQTQMKEHPGFYLFEHFHCNCANQLAESECIAASLRSHSISSILILDCLVWIHQRNFGAPHDLNSLRVGKNNLEDMRLWGSK